MNRPATRAINALRLHGRDSAHQVLESVAEEVPVAFLYNGRPFAVMMATPRDLADLAYGFSLSEGIVESTDELELIDQLSTDHGVSLEMLIPQRRYQAMQERQRNLTGRTGCGLCGASSLADAIRPVRRVSGGASLDVRRLQAGFRQLGQAQPFNDQCGALHAAAVLCSETSLIREDVGRHNAVDKSIGAALRSGLRPEALLVTSRASYEIVHKAAQVGCRVVAAVSAPTMLAIRIAEEAGLTLIGFARDDRMTVYSGESTHAAVLHG